MTPCETFCRNSGSTGANAPAGAEALQNYRYTWDETLRIFSRRLFHNWSAHGRDSLRYFATGHDDEMDADYTPSPPAEPSFDVYNYGKR